MLYENIKKLVEYGIQTGLTPECERIYTTNLLLELFHEDSYEDAEIDSTSIELEEVLKKVSVKDPDIPYVTNVTAEVVKSGEAIKELLVRQVSSSVRWEQSMRTMIAQGIDTFVEIGPGKTLSGFMKKIDKNVNMYRISTWEEAEAVCGELLKQ